VVPNILICDSNSMPQRWAHWQDATRLKYLGMVQWELGENEFTFHGGTSRITGEQSRITIPSIIGIKSKFSRKYKVPALTAENLFRRDLYLCAYCGRFCKGEVATMDHIVPVSKGGLHQWSNVVCACKKCNNHKDSKLLADTGMELLYVPYTPSMEENLILRNRNVLYDQAQFLANFLPEHSRAYAYVSQ